MRVAVLFILAMALLISCKSTYVQSDTPQEDVSARAERLAQQYIITDGHVDLPYRLKVRNFRLEREFLGIPIETDEGDFDFCLLYTSPSPRDRTRSRMPSSA